MDKKKNHHILEVNQIIRDKIVLTDLNNNNSCQINVVECDVQYFSHIEEHETENTQMKYLKLHLKVQCVGFSGI